MTAAAASPLPLEPATAPMTGQNIICFAKDWFEDPTSNHHVMKEVARHNRVLWLNSISTRAPNLASGRDLGKIARKVRQFLRGPQREGENLWVFSPLVLPLPHSKAALAINQQVLRATIWALRKHLGMNEFQLWTFLPNVADYVGTLGESLVVYYVVDEWSLFSYLDRDRTVAAERRRGERADVVFAVCDALRDDKRALNPNTHLATHGVDHALFARALDPALEVPADLARLPKPVIGFYGTLQDWVDQDLIVFLAKRHPQWSIALVGQELVDCSRLRALPNVHLFGRRPHAELPAHCKGFDVGIIPYRIDERMKFVNPIKLREYLSAGLPVVSTAVPEAKRYEPLCTIASDPEAFERAVERALGEGDLARRKARSQAMQSETWPLKVAEVLRRVAETTNARGPRARTPNGGRS